VIQKDVHGRGISLESMVSGDVKAPPVSATTRRRGFAMTKNVRMNEKGERGRGTIEVELEKSRFRVSYRNASMEEQRGTQRFTTLHLLDRRAKELGGHWHKFF